MKDIRAPEVAQRLDCVRFTGALRTLPPGHPTPRPGGPARKRRSSVRTPNAGAQACRCRQTGLRAGPRGAQGHSAGASVRRAMAGTRPSGRASGSEPGLLAPGGAVRGAGHRRAGRPLGSNARNSAGGSPRAAALRAVGARSAGRAGGDYSRENIATAPGLAPVLSWLNSTGAVTYAMTVNSADDARNLEVEPSLKGYAMNIPFRARPRRPSAPSRIGASPMGSFWRRSPARTTPEPLT